MSNLVNLIGEVLMLKDDATTWQLLPEHLTDTATDAITVAEYFGDDLTPVQVHRITDDLTSVLDFVKSASENI